MNSPPGEVGWYRPGGDRAVGDPKSSASPGWQHGVSGSQDRQRSKANSPPPSAALMLREHKETQETGSIMMSRVPSDANLVFANPDGTPLRPDSVTHAWARISWHAELMCDFKTTGIPTPV